MSEAASDSGNMRVVEVSGFVYLREILQELEAIKRRLVVLEAKRK